MRVVQAQAEAARLKLMSQALQRQLPRPNHKKLQVDSEVREGMSEVEKAAAMVEVGRPAWRQNVSGLAFSGRRSNRVAKLVENTSDGFVWRVLQAAMMKCGRVVICLCRPMRVLP